MQLKQVSKLSLPKATSLHRIAAGKECAPPAAVECMPAVIRRCYIHTTAPHSVYTVQWADTYPLLKISFFSGEIWTPTPHGSLVPLESTLKTASLSVTPFLHIHYCAQKTQTDRHTHTHTRTETTTRARSVATGRIYALCAGDAAWYK